MSDEGSITLDRKTFRVLASETRIAILKALDEKQKTISDLARELGMNKATVFEHLEQMADVGLVKRAEEEERLTTIKPQPALEEQYGPPRKWVYYRLTWKGRNILHPERVRIAILLCGLLTIFILSLVYVSYSISTKSPPAIITEDVKPPLIEFIDIGKLNEATRNINISVRIIDSSNIDENKTVVEYGISDKGLEIEGIKWKKVDIFYNYTKDGVYVEGFIEMQFSSYIGKYLVLKCAAYDVKGNLGIKLYRKYIEPLSAPDISLELKEKYFNRENGTYTIEVYVKNIGKVNAENVSIVLRNIRNDTIEITNVSISLGNYTILKWNVFAREGVVIVIADPENKLIETDEDNNILYLSLPLFKGKAKAMEKPAAVPGFESILILICLLFWIWMRRIKVCR
ncbi:MAG: ArsR family transcriptional regulator [Candidatus Thermoplasmatota archaeon]